ncbi:lachesin-like [Littorina saxatilis]|uniref:lachesin-like n=1 Tax=Littorina saxatilis TaxID=31220 RepID=UPI0038B4A245
MEDRRMINDMRISVERPFLWDWNLHIRNVSITDAGEYLCQLNTVPVQSKKINLLVNVPPSLADWTEPTEMTRMEGQLVELFCNATGVPEPKVTWHRMNKWQPGTSERVGSNGEHLVIHNVTRMCADTYYCVADNGVPPATKMEFHVNVNYPPEIDLHNGRIGQEVGKETILECVISASPLHVSRWRRGQEIYSNEGDRHEVNVYDNNKEPNSIVLSLRILRVEQQDYGTYTCEASNNFGTVVRDMELYEVRPRPPPTTPTTTTTTTSPDNVWRQQGGNSENIHRHGSGSRSKKPGQVGNYHGDRHSPDVIRNSQDSGSRNSGYAGNGAFGSTPRPSGQLGSGGMYDPNAREVYDQNGSRSISAYSHCILVMLCLTSSFLWMTLRDV